MEFPVSEEFKNHRRRMLTDRNYRERFRELTRSGSKKGEAIGTITREERRLQRIQRTSQLRRDIRDQRRQGETQSQAASRRRVANLERRILLDQRYERQQSQSEIRAAADHAVSIFGPRGQLLRRRIDPPTPQYPTAEPFDRALYYELESLSGEVYRPNAFEGRPEIRRRYYVEMGRQQHQLMNVLSANNQFNRIRVEPQDRPYLSNFNLTATQPLFSHDGYINLTSRELRRALSGGYTASQRGVFNQGLVGDLAPSPSDDWSADIGHWEVYPRNPDTGLLIIPDFGAPGLRAFGRNIDRTGLDVQLQHEDDMNTSRNFSMPGVDTDEPYWRSDQPGRDAEGAAAPSVVSVNPSREVSSSPDPEATTDEDTDEGAEREGEEYMEMMRQLEDARRAAEVMTAREASEDTDEYPTYTTEEDTDEETDDDYYEQPTSLEEDNRREELRDSGVMEDLDTRAFVEDTPVNEVIRFQVVIDRALETLADREPTDEEGQLYVDLLRIREERGQGGFLRLTSGLTEEQKRVQELYFKTITGYQRDLMEKVKEDYYEEYAQLITEGRGLSVPEGYENYLSNITSDFTPLFSYDGYINLTFDQLVGSNILNDPAGLNYRKGVYNNGAVRMLENELMKFAITTEALPPRFLGTGRGRFGGRFRVRTRNN